MVGTAALPAGASAVGVWPGVMAGTWTTGAAGAAGNSAADRNTQPAAIKARNGRPRSPRAASRKRGFKEGSDIVFSNAGQPQAWGFARRAFRVFSRGAED